MNTYSRFALVLCLFLAFPVVGDERTAWPDYMPTLSPGLSESSVSAELPADVVVTPPAAGLSAERAAWSGVWRGWACAAMLCDINVVVERVTQSEATVLFVGANATQGQIVSRGVGVFVGDELKVPLNTGSELVLRMRPTGDLEMSTWKPNARLLAAGVLTKKPIDYTRHLERIPTPWIEEDKALTLELVVYKPIGNGPFPTLVFNHGSTGSGTKPEWFTHTWTSPPLARHFTNRGWMVLFPQRRGRGKSDGLYDEGFVADRSRYACESTRTLAGFERALEDLDVAMQHVRAHRDVDRERVLVGGLSRGGILSIVYAASRKEWFGGVLNFVGGWVDEGCSVRENINPVVFRRGAPFGKPTLWLYGDDDPFYSLAHSAENFKAFKDAGGIGTFIEFQPPGNESGHNIYARPALWTDSMNAYLDSLGWR